MALMADGVVGGARFERYNQSLKQLSELKRKQQQQNESIEFLGQCATYFSVTLSEEIQQQAISCVHSEIDRGKVELAATVRWL